MMTYSNDWTALPQRPELEANDIHIWRVSLHAASIKVKDLFGLLANDEIDRALRFHFQRDHDRFVVVRGVLRILLSAYIQVPPEQIRFQYSTRGRLSLAFGQGD